MNENEFENKAKVYAQNASDSVRKEIALNLIQQGIDVDNVVSATNLPVDEITRIYAERKLV